MAAWDIDLTTRAGARTGAYQASLICFLFAGLSTLGLVFLGGLSGYTKGAISAVVFGVALLEIAVFLIAGFRLRQGKGFYWGVAAALLIVLTLAINLAGLALGAAGLDLVVLLFLGNGLRGAHALYRGSGFEDDDIGVFN